MLTEEELRIGRRNFLKAIAALPALGAFAWSAWRAERPLAVGIIGTGSEGRTLMEQTDGGCLRYVAVADIFPPHREKALGVARNVHDTEPDAYEDYRKMLARDDVEAVVIAAPLWMHAPMTIDALRAGKHVFCESAMGHSVEQCDEMAAAQAASGKVLQIGHQRRYNELYHHAVESIVASGMLGDIFHIRAQWHRDHSWRRNVPDVAFAPAPWGYASLEHLINWRMYHKYSQGLMAELGSHQLDVANWVTSSAPVSVGGAGGTYRYRDGREVEDHVFVTFEYPTDVTLTFSSIQSNAFDGYYEQIMGTKGTLILRGECEGYLFMERGQRSKSTEITIESVPGGVPLLEASASRAADAAGAGAAVGRSTSAASRLLPYRNELGAFARSVRTGEPPLCGPKEGRASAAAMLHANEAIRSKRRIELPGANLA